MNKGKTDKSGKYYQFYEHINKYNAYGARKLLERLNAAAESGDSRIWMWILERRLPEKFGKRVYIKINSVSDNKNENVELIVNNVDEIRKQILAKFDRF